MPLLAGGFGVGKGASCEGVEGAKSFEGDFPSKGQASGGHHPNAGSGETPRAKADANFSGGNPRLLNGLNEVTGRGEKNDLVKGKIGSITTRIDD